MKQLVLSLLFCGAFVAEAQSERTLSIRVEGNLRQMMNLTVELGEGVTKAVRVYSQPSGQLLGVLTHDDGQEAFRNSPWFQQNFPTESRGNRFPAASFPFAPGAKIIVQAQPAPITDDQIEVYVYGLWPTGDAAMPVQEREDKFTVATNVRNFGFTLTQTATETQVCCGAPTVPRAKRPAQPAPKIRS